MPLVSELLLVVIDPNHERFGQVAEFGANDWEGGQLLAEFPDGTSVMLYDGLDGNIPNPPQVIKVPKHLKDAMVVHQIDVMSIREKLRALWSVTQDEKLLPDVRLEAKRQIWELTALPGQKKAS